MFYISDIIWLYGKIVVYILWQACYNAYINKTQRNKTMEKSERSMDFSFRNAGAFRDRFGKSQAEKDAEAKAAEENKEN